MDGSGWLPSGGQLLIQKNKVAMKTFAIKLRAPIRISGVDFPGDYQIGAVTSEVNPIDLLGLIQFHHASVEEVTDAADDEIEEGDEAEQVEESPVADEQAVDPAADQPFLPWLKTARKWAKLSPKLKHHHNQRPNHNQLKSTIRQPQ